MWRKKFITISNKPVIFFWYSIKSVPKLGQYTSKLGQGWSKSCPNPTSFLGQYVPKLRQSGYILVQYGQLLDLHLLWAALNLVPEQEHGAAVAEEARASEEATDAVSANLKVVHIAPKCIHSA